MIKPLVAIVGRPNVGKSTFFNKICGKRIAIIKNIPGVTRDRIYADAEWTGHIFSLIDTGGIGVSFNDPFGEDILRQAKIAIESSSVVLFFVDGKEGLNPSDLAVAKILRASKKPVVVAVNKLDNFEKELAYDFYQLGLGEPMPISAEQSKGLGDLLDAVVAHLPKNTDYSVDPLKVKKDSISIAIVGKPNVGKSSIVNKLLGFERVIVSPEAGTTRDAIDSELEYKGKRYTIIDTAGMRRKRGIEDESVERYSVLRAIAAIKRADVVLNVFDSSEDISDQDVRIAGLVHEENKPSVIVMNKWDTIEKDGFTIEKYQKKLGVELAFMDYFTSIYTSAKTGQRVDKILQLVDTVHANAARRITTGTLNDIIADAVSMNEPPAKNGRRLKIYYATQSGTLPPKFIIFVNDETLVHFSYKRYIENCLRRAADFSGTPIQVIFVNKKQDN